MIAKYSPRRLTAVGTLYAAVLSVAVVTGCTMTESRRSIVSEGATEAVISFMVPQLSDSLSLEVYIPPGVQRAKSIIAFIDRGLDQYAYDDRSWRAMCRDVECALVRLRLPRQDEAPPEAQFVRNAALGGGETLLEGLRVAAIATHHEELRDARVLVFGFSAAGSFGATFAAWRPDRTIGFILYHGALRGVPVDTAALLGTPALIITGAADIAPRIEDARAFWGAARARGAPWAYASHIAQPHLSVDGLIEAGPMMRAWTKALLQEVLEAAARSEPSGRDRRPWLVEVSTRGMIEAATFSGLPELFNWLPDWESAQELRLLSGMCGTIPSAILNAALGGARHVDVDDPSTCHVTAGISVRELWVTTSRFADANAAQSELERAKSLAPASATVSELGEIAFFMPDPRQACSQLGVARSTRVYYAALCGQGFGVAQDSTALRPLMQAVLGKN